MSSLNPVAILMPNSDYFSFAISLRGCVFADLCEAAAMEAVGHRREPEHRGAALPGLCHSRHILSPGTARSAHRGPGSTRTAHPGRERPHWEATARPHPSASASTSRLVSWEMKSRVPGRCRAPQAARIAHPFHPLGCRNSQDIPFPPPCTKPKGFPSLPSALPAPPSIPKGFFPSDEAVPSPVSH